MESESGTNNTKISDSGYSNSCSNTTSQGSASSKSRHSGGSNSSRSSGYGGAPKENESGESDLPSSSKRNKDREHKKKKQKSSTTSTLPSLTTVPQTFTVPSETLIDAPSSVKTTMGVETVPSASVLEIAVPENFEAGIKNTEPLLTTAVPPVQNDVEIDAVEGDEEEKQQPWTEKEAVEETTKNEPEKDILEPDLMQSNQPEVKDGFCCVISMHDGVVLYTTPSLTSVLGFPKDTWLGHSFLDFVHPKDRETFSNHVSTSVAVPSVDSQGKVKDMRNYLYVCLRQHRSATNTPGVSLVEKPVPYQPFHLTVTIKQMADSPDTRLNDQINGLFLVIIAVPVYSAFKVPGERKKSTKFGMRHTATCIFSYVDPDVVTNFGFLPQDMLGKSVFDFYHPEDMPFLKEVYKSVMKTCQINGSVFRSKPYRFLVQNGCFVMIETEWSSVVNPWSRRLEFVISLHQVLQGPLNPNVFDLASNGEYKLIPEQVLRQGKLLQTEIVQLLTQELPRPAETGKLDVLKRCKDVANFMESLRTTSKLEVDVAQEFNPSMSERDSVMLGEISPHHDFCDSKSSSETPPSYNQLNYNENITRFFQSNPKTTGTSDESNSGSNAMDVDGKNNQDCVPCVPCAPNNQKCLSPLQNSGASGCGSAGNLSSGSNPILENGTTSGTNTSNDDYQPLELTESILARHNEDMEKIMVQKHKKARSHIKDRETKRSQQKLEKYANETLIRDDTNAHNHGVKRSGSRSWEEECSRLPKYSHQNPTNRMHEGNGGNSFNASRTVMNPAVIHSSQNLYRTENALQMVNDVNIWPPYSVSDAPNSQNSTAAVGFTASTPYTPGIFPLYYVPTIVPPARPISGNMELPQRYQVQYMPASLICNYNPIFIPQPILCPTVPMVPVPVPNNSSPTTSEGRNFGNNMTSPNVNPGPPDQTAPGRSDNNGSVPPSDLHQFDNNAPSGLRQIPQCDRPSSQATSVKAEPGSRIGSIASASVVHKALSECSRKDLGLLSVCSPDSPLVSPSDGETQVEQFNTNDKMMDTTKQPNRLGNNFRMNKLMDEESSWYSSSYSSLLKTYTGSGSNDDSTSNNNTSTNGTGDMLKKHQRNTCPMRKKDPPWVESVSVSSDLIYRYQMAENDLEKVLQRDLNTLKRTEQPMMVNDQLHQLYIEMELEGLSKALTLEEGFSSSSSSSDEFTVNSNPNMPKKKKRSYSSLMMIYEEDAPFPPPDADS